MTLAEQAVDHVEETQHLAMDSGLFLELSKGGRLGPLAPFDAPAGQAPFAEPRRGASADQQHLEGVAGAAQADHAGAGDRADLRHLEQHPRVHDPAGVQRPPYGSERFDLDRRFEAQGLLGLHGAEAMLGRNRARVLRHDVMDEVGALIA